MIRIKKQIGIIILIIVLVAAGYILFSKKLFYDEQKNIDDHLIVEESVPEENTLPSTPEKNTEDESIKVQESIETIPSPDTTTTEAPQNNEITDSKRRFHIVTLLDLLYEYHLKGRGDLPAGIDTKFDTHQMIGTSTGNCEAICTNEGDHITVEPKCINLQGEIDEIPIDPVFGSIQKTGYLVNKTSGGRTKITACYPYSGWISAQR